MEIIKVKRVIDGDTFVDDSEKHYRLASVYAPEANERGSEVMKKELEKLINRKKLEITWQQKKTILRKTCR